MFKKIALAALIALLASSGALAQGIVKGGTPQATAAAAGSLIFSPLATTTAAGKKLPNLLSMNATTGAAAGYLLIFDSATVPADGTVTPKYCFSIPANSSLPLSWDGGSAEFQIGVVAVLSTTGCYTKTIVTAANLGFISGIVK